MTRGKRKAVFLDRDGVLVEPEFRDGRSFAPRRLEDFRIYADAAPAVRLLKDAGFLTIVATNQPDVGAGRTERALLDAMHSRLREVVALDAIEVCCDTKEAGCPRRKPEPGMLLDAAQAQGIDLASSYMVGDRWSDVEAGSRAGCVSIFIDHGYTAESAPSGQAATVKCLAGAVDWILARERSGDAE